MYTYIYIHTYTHTLYAWIYIYIYIYIIHLQPCHKRQRHALLFQCYATWCGISMSLTWRVCEPSSLQPSRRSKVSSSTPCGLYVCMYVCMYVHMYVGFNHYNKISFITIKKMLWPWPWSWCFDTFSSQPGYSLEKEARQDANCDNILCKEWASYDKNVPAQYYAFQCDEN